MTNLNNHNDRAHALLSASSAARWLKCPPSAVAAALYPDVETEHTREGTLAHEVAEAVAKRYLFGADMPETGDEVTSEMLSCAIDYAEYIQEQVKSPDAVILLEQRVDFSPWVPDGFGTADCLIIQGTTLDVIDYKYGKGVAVSATENPQMQLYGLGALNEYGFAYDVERVRLHIYQPRLNNVSVYEIGVGELHAWAEMVVRPAAEKAARGEGEYAAGEHCRFCPHAGRCRTLAASCAETVSIYGREVTVEKLAAWEVAEILRQEQQITLWLKRVREHALASMLDGEEIPGHKVVAGRSSRAWACELEAVEELKKHGYTLEEITKTEILSPAAMEKALGKKKVAELVGGHIITHMGAPTIAPASDKRPTYDPAGDFDTLN